MKYAVYVLFFCILTANAWAVDRLVPSQHATIQAAHNAANTGDRILVSNGNYDETVSITKGVHFKSVNKHGAKLRGGNTRLHGFVVTTTGANGGSIDGFEIFGQMQRGISFPENIGAQNNWVFTNNKIHHVRQFGMYLRGTGHLVEDNYVYMIGNTAEAYGIYMPVGPGTARRNIVHTVSKNAMRTRGDVAVDSNLLYHSDTCLAVNGGAGGGTVYNNYIYDCLSAMKPKHMTCTAGTNGGRTRFWHNTVVDFGNSAFDIGENEPFTHCADGKNNVFYRNTPRGDTAVMENRVRSFNTQLDSNFYDVGSIPLYRNGATGDSYHTLAQVRTATGYEVNGKVGSAGLINLKQGVFYTPGSPVLNGGLTLASPYGNQLGARNIVQPTPIVEYVTTLRAISASAGAGTIARLTDGQKFPRWSPGNTAGWIVLETNNGNTATFTHFSWLAIGLSFGNINAFRLQSGPTANGPWTTILTNGGNTDRGGSYSFFDFTNPQTAAYLRFNYDSTFDNQLLDLGEIAIFTLVPQAGTPPPPPPPDCPTPPCDDPPPPPPAEPLAPPLFDGGSGSGTQYYISPTGTATTCPTSGGTPCSWNNAINAAQPNDSIIFKDGTYNITLTTVRSGLVGQHIVIRAENSGVPLINGSAQDLVHINHSYITFRGLHFFDTKTGLPNAQFSGGGLVLMRINNSSGAHHIIIEDNIFEHCANACINAFGITNVNTHIIIRNNMFDGAGYKADAGGRPIRISTPNLGNPGVRDVVIHNNMIQDFTGPAIEVSETGQRVWIYNNAVHSAATAAAHGTSPEPPRDGLILIRGSQVYMHTNWITDAAFGAKILTVRNSSTTNKSLIYNNIFDSITGNNDAIYCEAGNTGAAAEIYSNTFYGLTDHTVGTVNCTPTIINNIGINGVTGNLPTTSFTDSYFNDAGGGDFSLTVNAVNAIDAVTTAPFSTSDIFGKGIFGAARDYGAFEYGGFDPPPPPPTSNFPTKAILDNFNRANENPVAGIWANGITGVGSCQIISNTLRRSTGTFDCYVNTQYGRAQEAYATVPNADAHGDGTSCRLMMCSASATIGQTTNTGYRLRLQKRSDTDRLMIERRDAGGSVQLGGEHMAEITSGDKLGLEILADGTINAWANQGTGWAFQFSRMDTTYNCTNTYIGAWLGGNANQHFDDFGGGTSLTSSPGNLLIAPILFFD